MSRMTMVAALNGALRDAMTADDRVLVMGEDVAALGGVFRVTQGLLADFGARRVIDTPLAESAIIGTAIGLAMRGYRPVCEIQFDGFVFPAFDQITTQLSRLRSRTHGQVTVPVVVRIPYGGGIGAVEHHSEAIEAYFTHTPGLRVVTCADPHDAHWMLREAIAGEDPVVFLEPKRRYWETGDVGAASDLPLHRARIRRAGRDVTLVTYGPQVATCMAAAAQLSEIGGPDVEVVDLRSLSPLDLDCLVASVRRTGRCVVVHEAPRTGGLGADIAAELSQRCFGELLAPVTRITGYDVPYPPAAVEHLQLPDIDRVLDGISAVLEDAA